MKVKDIIEGKYISNERGFGFVEVDNEENDIFIPPNMDKGAMTGDIVKVKINTEEKENHRAEGEIVEIIKRSTVTVVGTFQKSKNYGFVVPDDIKLGIDIFISKSNCLNISIANFSLIFTTFFNKI